MTVEFIVTVQGFNEAQQRLRAVNRQRIVRGTQFFARRRLEEGLERVKEEAPVGETNVLRDSIGIDVKSQGDVLTGSLTASAKHAKWVHEGTGIYGPSGDPIIPQRSKVLVFFWNRKNRWMRVRSVRGQSANPFLRRGAKILRDRVASTLPKEVRQDIKALLSGGSS
ncbi:hypothetical protein LCGC14_0448650 [marine sediment metagenome]|uniref:HK97 gp10 family phage protein n=1 Tax=marine sediment metagenome TaxID=412755 RepID=A0A0F9SNX3_9ZZZZ